MKDRTKPTGSAQHDALAKLLSGVEAATLLDVACGDGEFTEIVVELLPSLRRVYGIDPSSDELDQARRYFPRAQSRLRCNFRVGVAERLPYADASFPLVTISNALHHVTEPRRALAEIARVVAPDGTVIVHEMCSDELPAAQQNGRELHHIKAEIDSALGHTHRHTYSRTQIRDFIESAGLTVEALEEYDPEGLVGPADDQLDERIAFLVDYLDPLADSEAYARLKRKVMKLSTSLRENGFAPARQLLLRAAVSR